MTDTENTPVCRAQYSLNAGGPWDCVLSEGHVGPHRDEEHDTWDITYRDRVPFVLKTRPVQDQVTDLAARVGLLEAAWTVGGETLSERLDRVMLGLMEEIRTVARRVDNLEQTSASGAAVDDMFVTMNRRLVVAESEQRAVTLSTDEYTALLKDRGELHALRNAAQSDVTADTSVDDQHRANHECGPAC